ncbi:hypothetical protein G6F22_013250 [Rhizopus arrhizus]|nr:hypothetical protein G6F22_013250 [Rhizopus arrhizus]
MQREQDAPAGQGVADFAAERALHHTVRLPHVLDDLQTLLLFGQKLLSDACGLRFRRPGQLHQGHAPHAPQREDGDGQGDELPFVDGAYQRDARDLDQRRPVLALMRQLCQELCLRRRVDQHLRVVQLGQPLRRGAAQGGFDAAEIAVAHHGANDRGAQHAADHAQGLQQRRGDAQVRAPGGLLRKDAVGGNNTQTGQGHQQEAGVEHPVGVADARDDAAVDDAAHGDEDDHGRDQQAGVLGRQAKAALQQQGRVEQQRIHRDAHQQRQREERGQAAVAEHVQRQERVRAALFPPVQQREGGDAAHAQQHDRRADAFLGQQLDQQLQAAECGR